MDANQAKVSTLVIGSTGHKLAEKCVNWGDTVYVGDHDLVIVDLTSLNEHILGEICGINPNYLFDLKEMIVEAQSKKSLKVICIIDEFFITDRVNKNEKKISNYSWCPVIPIFEEKPGNKIDRVNSDFSLKYVKHINSWDRLLDQTYNNTGYQENESKSIHFKIYTKKIIVNQISRAIVFSLSWKLYQYSEYTTLVESKEPIIFLPKIDDSKNGIDLLLEDFALSDGEDEPAPSWINEIPIFGEKDIFANLEQIDNSIKKLIEEKQNEEAKLKEKEEFKKLLYLKGIPLEMSVENSFKYLEIALSSPITQGQEDRFFIKEDANIPIEIRGKNNEGLNEKDLNQLVARLVDRSISVKYKTRGLFILNHYKDKKPEEREDAFTHNIIGKAKAWDLCLVSTETIFNLVNKKLQGGDLANLKTTLFNTIGVFNEADLK